jgi:hypothetical protein
MSEGRDRDRDWEVAEPVEDKADTKTLFELAFVMQQTLVRKGISRPQLCAKENPFPKPPTYDLGCCVLSFGTGEKHYLFETWMMVRRVMDKAAPTQDDTVFVLTSAKFGAFWLKRRDFTSVAIAGEGQYKINLVRHDGAWRTVVPRIRRDPDALLDLLGAMLAAFVNNQPYDGLEYRPLDVDPDEYEALWTPRTAGPSAPPAKGGAGT